MGFLATMLMSLLVEVPQDPDALLSGLLHGCEVFIRQDTLLLSDDNHLEGGNQYLKSQQSHSAVISTTS